MSDPALEAEDQAQRPAFAASRTFANFESLIPLALVLAIFAVYAQALRFDLITCDDYEHVWPNPAIPAGLTSENIIAAFTTPVVGHWIPVTELSHLAVAQFFGLNGGMHHGVNVLIHALAALMLFAAFRLATGNPWPSFLVAFLFALHPLHVESVCWVAERKDLLSGFFLFVAFYAYVRYTESPDLKQYLMVVLPFCLALMSKSMVVTFPFVLLLFDFWPLRRARTPRILWEKLPLLALSAITCILAYHFQNTAGAVVSWPLSLRLENALVSYVVYILQTFWPARLAIYYSTPESVPAWQVAGATLLILAVTALAVHLRRTRPYVLAGWLWYLGTLVPVIGLVQIASQSHADHFTYLPLIGLFWILAWGVADAIEYLPRLKPMIVSAVAAVCVLVAAISWTQAAYWQNGVTIFQHAREVLQHDEPWVISNLAMAHAYVGVQMAGNPDRYREALDHFQAAITLSPTLASAHRNLGILLSSIPGREQDAIAALENAQRLTPDPKIEQMIRDLRKGRKQE